ncbi:MAG: TerB family tellurite resistance protein [Anaerolineales bacterium]
MPPRSDLIFSLGKVMIAAAWADHDLSEEEVNSLKDLLFHLPELNASQWAELDIYLHSPVSEAERDRLLEELQRQIRTDSDKELALEALESVAEADQESGQTEQQVFNEIREAIETADTGVVGLLGGLMTGAIQRRGRATSDFPNREEKLDDFVRNRIYYSLVQRMKRDPGAVSLDIPEDQLRTLSLAGGLMARVAHVDAEVTENELQAIVEALTTYWQLGEEAALFVAGVATSEIANDLDLYRLTREFYEATDRDQRLHFLEVLFQVAAADGQATHEEIEEIRRITRTLKLSHRNFINAKLTLPKERRSS